MSASAKIPFDSAIREHGHAAIGIDGVCKEATQANNIILELACALDDDNRRALRGVAMKQAVSPVFTHLVSSTGLLQRQYCLRVRF